jgi:transcriptional regulator
MLGGTLDMMILRVLRAGRAHGFTIAASIQRRSEAALLVEQGSLYPALHRLEERGWIRADWGTSENNRRARFYALTAVGRTQLRIEASRWARLAQAVARVMHPAEN